MRQPFSLAYWKNVHEHYDKMLKIHKGDVIHHSMRDWECYLSWRYELYSRIVGIASNHHKINLYITTEFRGGIQRQNFKKNVLSSTVKNTVQRLRTWINRQGPCNGCHSSLSHCAGVNWPNVRFTCSSNQSALKSHPLPIAIIIN